METFEDWWTKTKSIVSESDRTFAESIARIAYNAGINSEKKRRETAEDHSWSHPVYR